MPTADEPTETMSTSMSLDGDVDKLAEYYDGWAQTYDGDVASHDYGLPPMIVEMLQRVAGTPTGPEVVLDAGCGTGLVGVELAAAGFTAIDGIDLSHEMVAIARDRGIYRSLHGGVDLTQPMHAMFIDAYDIVTIAGVFTVGHVPPSALANVATMVRPGGLLVASTRDAYYAATDYQQVNDRLVADGTLDLELRVDGAPYTMDSTASYWAYRRPT